MNPKSDFTHKPFKPRVFNQADFQPMFKIKQQTEVIISGHDNEATETKDFNKAKESKMVEVGQSETQDKKQEAKQPESEKKGGNAKGSREGAVPKQSQSSEEKGSSAKVLTETLPKELVEMKHPLNTGWSLWYFINDRSKSWEDCLQNVFTVRTVEDFWYVHKLLY